MSDFLYNKIDFIIMIILALLVAFIIGFNIIQIVDSKLSSVTINVPSQNYQLPPIYLSVDKELGDFKQIKLNDVVSTISNESIYETNDVLENNKFENFENFKNIKDYPSLYSDDNKKKLISDTINSDYGINKINSINKLDNDKDNNYNSVNDIPLLISPDTNVPNSASLNAKGYYSSRVKLIENSNSPLLKLAKTNYDKINQTIANCVLSDSLKIPRINGTYDGYNSFVDLKEDSYANIKSIGKSLLTPYVSYPVPS